MCVFVWVAFFFYTCWVPKPRAHSQCGPTTSWGPKCWNPQRKSLNLMVKSRVTFREGVRIREEVVMVVVRVGLWEIREAYLICSQVMEARVCVCGCVCMLCGDSPSNW